jgi:hypothetical protein
LRSARSSPVRPSVVQRRCYARAVMRRFPLLCARPFASVGDVARDIMCLRCLAALRGDCPASDVLCVVHLLLSSLVLRRTSRGLRLEDVRAGWLVAPSHCVVDAPILTHAHAGLANIRPLKERADARPDYVALAALAVALPVDAVGGAVASPFASCSCC